MQERPDRAKSGTQPRAFLNAVEVSLEQALPAVADLWMLRQRDHFAPV
jgi:hypothetical protein